MKMITVFLDHLCEERQLSQHTVIGYKRDLFELSEYLEPLSIASWPEVASHHLQGFITSGHRQGRSGRTLRRKLSACRTFFNYLAREGLIKANPALYPSTETAIDSLLGRSILVEYAKQMIYNMLACTFYYKL